jgi:hypothetical protein
MGNLNSTIIRLDIDNEQVETSPARRLQQKENLENWFDDELMFPWQIQNFTDTGYDIKIDF